MNTNNIGRELAKCKGNKDKVNKILKERGIPYRLNDDIFKNTKHEHNWTNLITGDTTTATLKRLILEEEYREKFDKFKRNDDIEFIRGIVIGEGIKALNEYKEQGIDILGESITDNRQFIIFKIVRSNTYVCERVEWFKDKKKAYIIDKNNKPICLYYEDSLSYRLKKENIYDILDEDKNKAENINPDLIYGKSSSNEVYVKCYRRNPNHPSFLREASRIDGKGCKYCHNSGTNDTTVFEDSLEYNYPNVAKCVVSDIDGNKVDTSKVKPSSHLKYNFLCDVCGQPLTEAKTIDKAVREGHRCKKCQDGMSLPEKFTKAIFNQAGVLAINNDRKLKWAYADEKYVNEFLNKNEDRILEEIKKRTGEEIISLNYLIEKKLLDKSKLVGRKFMDFHIPEGNPNVTLDQPIIIECQGEQHFVQGFISIENIDKLKPNQRTVYEEIINDMIKEQLAKDNNFKFIAIDCRNTNWNNLKEQNIKALDGIIDLSNINWDKVIEDCIGSRKKVIWKLRDNGKTNKEICEYTGYCLSIVIDVLKWGTQLGKLKRPYHPGEDKIYNGEHGRQEVTLSFNSIDKFINTLNIYFKRENIRKNINLKDKNIKSNLEDLLNCKVIFIENQIKLVFKSQKDMYKQFLNISHTTFKNLINSNDKIDSINVIKKSNGQIKGDKVELIEAIDGCDILIANSIY